jgi:hypothetical protein
VNKVPTTTEAVRMRTVKKCSSHLSLIVWESGVGGRGLMMKATSTSFAKIFAYNICMTVIQSSLLPTLYVALQPKSHLCISRRGNARPQSQFPHSCVCEWFIYFHAGSVHIFSCSRIGRPILGIYKSLVSAVCTVTFRPFLIYNMFTLVSTITSNQ